MSKHIDAVKFILDDEPIFVLRGRDALAAKIVAELPKVQAESEAAQAASMLRRTVMGV